MGFANTDSETPNAGIIRSGACMMEEKLEGKLDENRLGDVEKKNKVEVEAAKPHCSESMY
jgi:hypothetical protein